MHGRTPSVRFVDVFSASPCRGNAVAVFHDADDLADDEMAVIARWTNLSETTFLCTPTDPAGDYRVRIWTTGGELPFAGHPTLGSAHAWLEAGGVPASQGLVVQQCAAGQAQWLVPIDHLPTRYVAAQGTVVGRSGRVHVDVEGGTVWVGGETRTIVTGELGAADLYPD